MQWLRRRSLCRPLAAPSDRPAGRPTGNGAADQPDDRERGERRAALCVWQTRRAAVDSDRDWPTEEESTGPRSARHGATPAAGCLCLGLCPVPSGRSLSDSCSPRRLFLLRHQRPARSATHCIAIHFASRRDHPPTPPRTPLSAASSSNFSSSRDPPTAHGPHRPPGASVFTAIESQHSPNQLTQALVDRLFVLGGNVRSVAALVLMDAAVHHHVRSESAAAVDRGDISAAPSRGRTSCAPRWRRCDCGRRESSASCPRRHEAQRGEPAMGLQP